LIRDLGIGSKGFGGFGGGIGLTFRAGIGDPKRGRKVNPLKELTFWI